MAAFALLLAIGVCAWLGPPKPEDVAAIFSRPAPRPQALGPTSAPDVSAILLPERNWYLVISDGQTVAALDTLVAAEILRDQYGELAAIEPLSTDRITLRVTATKPQLDALQEGAKALHETFDLIGQIPHLDAAGAKAAARQAAVDLRELCRTLETVLRGTENPVVRGLAGLVGSCQEAVNVLQNDPTPEAAQRKLAGLALQYQAYTEFLSGAGR